jgi:hypothetical protein
VITITMEVATEIATAVEFTSRELSAIAMELRTAASREVGSACAWTDARLSTAYRGATAAHAATRVHSAASAHATATHAASAHATATAHRCAATPSAAATTTTTAAVVLCQCRASNCQSERQSCRAQNTKFRHHASPKKDIEQNISAARWFRFGVV